MSVKGFRNLEEMQIIKTVDDASSFTEEIIAYKSEKHFFESYKQFFFEASKGINFGYLADHEIYSNKGKEFGKEYTISRLLQSDAGCMSCSLSNEELEEDPMQMRLATISEQIEIAKAIKDKKAEFEYGFVYEKRIDSILKKALSLPSKEPNEKKEAAEKKGNNQKTNS